MAEGNKITKTIIATLILALLILTACVDKSAAVQLCADKGLQYTGKTFGSDIECVNVTSGQLFRYSGEWQVIVKRR